jgi:hypothetical protein
MEIGSAGIMIETVPSEQMEQKRHPMENTIINDFIMISLCSSLFPISADLLWPLQTGLRLPEGHWMAPPSASR